MFKQERLDGWFGDLSSTIFDTAGKVGTSYMTLEQAKEKRKALEAEAARLKALNAASARQGMITSHSIAGIPWNTILIVSGVALVGLVVLRKRTNRRKRK